MTLLRLATNFGAEVSGNRLTKNEPAVGRGRPSLALLLAISELMRKRQSQRVGDRAAAHDAGHSVDPVDLSGDAARERVGAGQKRVVPGVKLDQPNVLFDALTLHLSRSR